MAYNHHDDSFFIESDEPSFERINPRHAAKMVARQRQDMIAGELSRLAGEEYLEDILQHMATLEVRNSVTAQHRHPLLLTWIQEETAPDANLIDMQREIQWFMRPYLIDFIVEAHAAFALLPETLFLTINLLDRYCSRRVVFKHHYQLVGCAALVIAAKYGDKKDRVPQMGELNNMCCGLYDLGMFIQMETHVLNTLEWAIGHPTVDFFTQLMAAEECDDAEVEHMAAYLCEIALYHRDFVSTKPSMMARASLALARAILGRPEVNDGEWAHTENVTLLTLSQHLSEPSPTLARKYATPDLSRVSQKLADFMAEQAAIARRANPPSPQVQLAVKASNIYSTPQKGHGAATGFEGYLTPPITPDGVQYGHGQAQREVYTPLPPRCPVTPTPHQNQGTYAAQGQQGHINQHYMQY